MRRKREVVHRYDLALTDTKTLALARALYDGGPTSIATIFQTLGISRVTLYRSFAPLPGRHGLVTEHADTN